MLRFLARLLKIDYQPCNCCEVTQRQLDIANAEKKELLETMLDILRPERKQDVQIHFAHPNANQPQVVRPRSMRWDARKVELEREARSVDRLKHDNPDIAADIAKLENELEIPQSEAKNAK